MTTLLPEEMHVAIPKNSDDKGVGEGGVTHKKTVNLYKE